MISLKWVKGKICLARTWDASVQGVVANGRIAGREHMSFLWQSFWYWVNNEIL